MLTEEQFRGKKYIIMDKPTHIIVMTKKLDGYWLIVSASKNEVDINIIDNLLVHEIDAYNYYTDRMISYNYNKFTVITKPE